MESCYQEMNYYHSEAHLLQQGPGLEEAEAGVAGVQVEAQRGVEAPPARVMTQGGWQLTRGPRHWSQHVTIIMRTSDDTHVS